jgi:hypothetical protein
MLFVRCYPRETQEMMFDAHDRAPSRESWPSSISPIPPQESRIVESITRKPYDARRLRLAEFA